MDRRGENLLSHATTTPSLLISGRSRQDFFERQVEEWLRRVSRGFFEYPARLYSFYLGRPKYS